MLYTKVMWTNNPKYRANSTFFHFVLTHFNGLSNPCCLKWMLLLVCCISQSKGDLSPAVYAADLKRSFIFYVMMRYFTRANSVCNRRRELLSFQQAATDRAMSIQWNADAVVYAAKFLCIRCACVCLSLPNQFIHETRKPSTDVLIMINDMTGG